MRISNFASIIAVAIMLVFGSASISIGAHQDANASITTGIVSIPLFPNSCRDTEGRMRSDRPCRDAGVIDAVSNDGTFGEPSVPLFPNSCRDTEGRMRSDRPCKGN